MIKSFRDKHCHGLFSGEPGHRKWRPFERIARRKLLLLAASQDLQDLRSPPGNRLEELQGDRRGQHSIRIDDTYRVCFNWIDGHAHDVEIVDYHKG